MWLHYELLRRCSYDAGGSTALVQKLAKPDRDPPAGRRNLLRLPLFSRHARRESVDRTGDCFPHPDADLDIAEPRRDWLDPAELLGFSRHRAGGYFSTGTSSWFS